MTEWKIGASDAVILPVVDEGLGNSTYLVDLGDGRAVAIDPSRDLRALDAQAAHRNVMIAFAAETHLHADFVSGSTRLAARDRATVLGSAAGNRDFPHRRLADGDEVDLGGLTLRSWTTPGHTFEHLAYLLCDGADVRAVFTGGSLLVGAAARTDLTGPLHTEALAREQFRSLRRLADLPDDVLVLPTHGAGSFCSAPPGAERASTIAREKATNALLGIEDEDEFVTALIASLGTFPPYFLRLGEVNRRGPAVPADNAMSAMSALSPAAVGAATASGAVIVDVRPVREYATAHVARSLSIELRPAFATWLGWLVPDASTPLVIVRNADQDPEEVVWQARKIDYTNIVGELDVDDWHAAGHPLVSTKVATAGDVDTTQLLDIRQHSEYAAGHAPNARNIELGDLATAKVPSGPLVAMCGHGERAASAASVLERDGREDVAILMGGPGDWAPDGTARQPRP